MNGDMIGAAGASWFIFRHHGGWDGRSMTEVLPLYVLLEVMRQRWEIEDYDGAVALARIAAPYLHGKAPLARPGGDLAGVTDEELERVGRECRDEQSGRGGEAAANENTEELA